MRVGFLLNPWPNSASLLLLRSAASACLPGALRRQLGNLVGKRVENNLTSSRIGVGDGDLRGVSVCDGLATDVADEHGLLRHSAFLQSKLVDAGEYPPSSTLRM